MLFFVYVLNDIVLSVVEFMNYSRNLNVMIVSWFLVRSFLDGYIISIFSDSLMKEEILFFTKRQENIEMKLYCYMECKINILYIEIYIFIYRNIQKVMFIVYYKQKLENFAR